MVQHDVQTTDVNLQHRGLMVPMSEVSLIFCQVRLGPSLRGPLPLIRHWCAMSEVSYWDQ